jgi:hypothetical protein
MRRPLSKRRQHLSLRRPLLLKHLLSSSKYRLLLLLKPHLLKLLSSSLKLRPPQRRQPHRLLPLVQLSRAELLRANLPVMRLAKFRAPPLLDPTRRVRRPLVAHPAQPLLVVPLVRRLAVPSAQLVVQFRRRLAVR